MNESHCLSSPCPGHDSSVGGWMNPTVCPLHGPGLDSAVGEWMNLTVCPLYGSDHDRSVGEWTNLTVGPLRGPDHDSPMGGDKWTWLSVLSVALIMIAQWGRGDKWTSLSVLSVALIMIAQLGEWMNLTVCPLFGPGSIPDCGRMFQWIFPWPLTLCQPTFQASMAENGSISPLQHHTTCRPWEGWPIPNQPLTDTDWKKTHSEVTFLCNV